MPGRETSRDLNREPGLTARRNSQGGEGRDGSPPDSPSLRDSRRKRNSRSRSRSRSADRDDPPRKPDSAERGRRERRDGAPHSHAHAHDHAPSHAHEHQAHESHNGSRAERERERDRGHEHDPTRRGASREREAEAGKAGRHSIPGGNGSAAAAQAPGADGGAHHAAAPAPAAGPAAAPHGGEGAGTGSGAVAAGPGPVRRRSSGGGAAGAGAGQPEPRSPRGGALRREPSGSGAPRLLVSFSDELDEEGGLGGGTHGVVPAPVPGAGGRRSSGGAGGVGAGGGVGGGGGLAWAGGASSMSAGFLREGAAAQRMSGPGLGLSGAGLGLGGGGVPFIPPRTITTSSSGGPSGAQQSPHLAGSMYGTHAHAHTHGQGRYVSPSPPPGLDASYARAGPGSGPGGLGSGLLNPPVHPAGMNPFHRGPGGGPAGGLAVVDDGAVAVAVGAPSGRSGATPPRSPPGGRTLGRIIFGMASARCARPYMEDRHCIVQCLRPLSASGQPLEDGVPRCLAAIYDGHNGTRAADTAATRLHMLLAGEAALRTHTGERCPPAAARAEEEAIAGALRKVFRRLDDAILAEARSDGARDGATALLVLRLSDTLYAAHAGDSRAVLSRRGEALRLTEDHKPHLPLERQRVEAAGGRVDFQRCWRVIVEPREGRLGSGLAVSRSLGDLDFKEPRRFVECEPDVRRLVPGPGDNLIVLGSDGLWDVMNDQEAVDVANAAVAVRGPGTAACAPPPPPPPRAPPPPPAPPPPGTPYREEDARAAAEALLEAAVRRGTADNVTVIVMLLQWD
ncbi:hypothetical protein HYH03_015250 [Edaphochlamys debaryana]|uniref:PPM-type phosphatase domain-containing protein n=1 Tax=Edaphochlamys debaryana TaxID=47281 RepID=A0A836BSR0_9CHLO|nr:hypothetical protein HYH03_015250 [Edaphochlamys debaryana]|eukprot:KAG2486043.1 hypothetical protein HYH03_015250 [Edaphochlamys debaryana]